MKQIFNSKITFQLATMTLESLDRECVGVTLNKFGPYLKNLRLLYCDRVVLNQLGACNKLELLDMSNTPIISDQMMGNCEATNNCWTPESFLPLLKYFDTNNCLGEWAPLFERKSTLVHLSLLCCCHIGTNVKTI